MKLSTIYSKIKFLCCKHTWKYNQPKLPYQKEYWIGGSAKLPIESHSTRICEKCFRKEKRNIVDLGRGMYWNKTDEYTQFELREMNLKKLLED